MTEISYNAARAQQVKALIAEFPEAKFESGPKVLADSMGEEYRISDPSGAEHTIIDQRSDGRIAMEFRIRQQMRSVFPKKTG